MLVPAFVLAAIAAGPKPHKPLPLQPGSWLVTTTGTLPRRFLEEWKYCLPRSSTVAQLVRQAAGHAQGQDYDCNVSFGGHGFGSAFCTKLNQGPTGMNVILRLNWRSIVDDDGKSVRVNVGGGATYGSPD